MAIYGTFYFCTIHPTCVPGAISDLHYVFYFRAALGLLKTTYAQPSPPYNLSFKLGGVPKAIYSIFRLSASRTPL
jgi:hypothetical protein